MVDRDITTGKYLEHPLACIFPMMDAKSFEELKADIAANGIQQWGLLYEGKILDGRNRYRACQELGIEMTWSEIEPEDLATFDPLQYVLSLNLHRRHLSESQRAMVAEQIASLSAGGDRKSENFKGQICTLKDAAEKLNVSERTVKNARTVVKSGDQELIESVKDGKVKVSKAAKIVKERQQPPADDEYEDVVYDDDDDVPPNPPRHPGEHNQSKVFAIGKADVAITQLKGIPANNPYRNDALRKIAKWLQREMRGAS